MRSPDLVIEPNDGVDGGEQLEEVVPRLAALVGQVGPGDLLLSTPCDGWTTRDLLNHVAGGARMFADAFEGAPVPDISGRLPDVVGDDPVGAFESAVARFGDAAQRPHAMDQVLTLPVGMMTGRTYLRFAAFDLLVHSWDLAMTLDAPLDVPDDLVDEIGAFAHVVLNDWTRDGVNFSERMPVPDGATRLDALAAFTGRDLTRGR